MKDVVGVFLIVMYCILLVFLGLDIVRLETRIETLEGQIISAEELEDIMTRNLNATKCGLLGECDGR